MFVVLTGIGFGALTGLAYSSESYWWVGMIAGVVSGYPLAKLYLMQLIKISTKGHNKKAIWFLSTLVAIICGVICTTLVHGIMTLIIACNSDVPVTRQMDGFWSTIFMVGELVGACAGLIVGGICSLVYVSSIMDKSNETS